MSFNLELRFIGLLHYVQNENTTKKVRLCVVLSKAVGHTGKISAAADTKLGDADPDGVAIDGVRAVLRFSPASTNFDFEGPVIGGTIKGAVPLTGLIGDSADKSAEIVSVVPSPSVRSQVLVGTGGTFQVSATASPPKLELPANALNHQVSTTFDFAEDFTMTVAGVDAAELIIFPLTNSLTPIASYNITTTGTTASLTLSHTCFATGTPHTVPFKDDDFRFQYMMLKTLPLPTLKDMPVPNVLKFSGASMNFRLKDHRRRETIKPDGCDCAGTVAISRPYDLDQFMSV
jgi:hypothetical protein